MAPILVCRSIIIFKEKLNLYMWAKGSYSPRIPSSDRVYWNKQPIGSIITVNMKSWKNFLHRVLSGHFFLNSWSSSDTTYIRTQDGADVGFFGFYKNGQKLLKMIFWSLKWSSLNRWGKLNKKLFSIPKIHYFCWFSA